MESKLLSNQIFKCYIAIWFEFYQEKTGEKPIFDPIDARKIKSLMKKIETKLTGRSMDVTIDNMTNSFRAFLWSINNKWHLENLELKNIDSNFNSLYVSAAKASPLGIRESVEEYISKRNSERAG